MQRTSRVQEPPKEPSMSRRSETSTTPLSFCAKQFVATRQTTRHNAAGERGK
jgi:hypothetical protein